MKKPYQIEAQRAMKRLEEMAADGNAAVQLVLPMAEVMGWLKQGVGELIRQAGVQIIALVMEEEARELVGERSQPQAERKANRWGRERGYCVVMGQKLPIERPRVRSSEDREVRLGSYELFHRGEPLTDTVWEKLMLGLSTRNCGQAVRQFTEAYGLEKSAVSEHFIEASRAKLKQLMERRLDKTRFCALLIDATPFEGQQMVAALCIGQDGRKTILGIRQGATENATVVGELLGDLAERGFDFTATRLYVLDGGKALSAAVKTHAGDSALIQRCQVHKRRNVLDHLPEDHKTLVAQKLNAAYAVESYDAAKLALNKLHRELMDFNPSAARSLAEGMEETLTVHKLQVPPPLRQTLASTNVIESAFCVVEKVCANVKRWHPGDQRERWVGLRFMSPESVRNTLIASRSDIQLLASKRLEELPLPLRQYTAFLLVSLGLRCGGETGGNCLVRGFFPVYEALATNSYSWESWLVLSPELPYLGLWSEWDRCKKLRRAVRKAFPVSEGRLARALLSSSKNPDQLAIVRKIYRNLLF